MGVLRNGVGKERGLSPGPSSAGRWAHSQDAGKGALGMELALPPWLVSQASPAGE